MKNRRKSVLILVILFISIGFAVLSTNLNLNGAFNFQEASWNIYLDNIQVTEGSVEADLPVISDKTTINFEGELSKPGEFYEFSVDVVNAGTIDAVIGNVEKTALTEEQAKYIDFTTRYYKREDLDSNIIVRAGEQNKIVIRVEYKYDIERIISLPSNTFSLTLIYKQANPKVEYIDNAYLFEYTGSEEVFKVPKTGTYKIETWGAQGGTVNYNSKVYRGGYGGYSVGTVLLNKSTNIYINVGGQGESGVVNTFPQGGYNGGGSTPFKESVGDNRFNAGGGGATHIAKVSGLLSSLESNLNEILIVSGGGGGGYKHIDKSSDHHGIGGDAGGFTGNDGQAQVHNQYYGKGGTQTSAGCSETYGTECGGFGYGGNVGIGLHGSSGGAGLYGGGGCQGQSGFSNGSGGGGSSYIGNTLLTNKSMYCFGCQTSSDINTKTISTTNVSEEPISKFAKKGNGFARITYLG